MQEVYISTDVESNGPIPGCNSMLSFGSVAFDPSGREVGSFTRNLELLEGAVEDPDTMAWWNLPKNKQAWEACRQNTVHPSIAMREYVAWVESLKGHPVFVAYPAGYDFMFVYWHLIKFVGKSPFSFSALDMKSFAMAVMQRPYRECTKRNMPRRWFPDIKHSHVALDDAREQGLIFINMLNDSLKI